MDIREEILNYPDLVTEDVFIPEWNRTVRVRALSGAERDQFEQSQFVKKGKTYELTLANIRARLVALSVVDDRGSRVFGDADVELLGRKSAAALDAIFEVARRLSRISREDVEELTKNSEPGPSADSISN